MELIDTLALFLRSNMRNICFGVTAVSLMVFGRPLNSMVKKFTRKMNWILRYCVYIALCTVGYGFLARYLYRGLRFWLGNQSNVALIVWVVSIYLVLAWFAKAEKEI